MSATNFGLLTSEQKTAWSLDFWGQARNLSFVDQFLGKGQNSVVQHITELTKSKAGARAVITLLTDMEGDGVAGDRTLKGNEEGLKSYDRVITIDQLRNANKTEGKMADQKTIVSFREQSRDKLAVWAADRIDQLAFLTMAGLSYNVRNSAVGAPVGRVGSDLPYLEFAKDVAAPSAKRFGRWNAAAKTMEWGVGTGSVADLDTPSYAMLVQAKAYAKDNYIRGVRENGGKETYHVFLSPMAMAKLKLDADYLANLRGAGQRGKDNALFTGDAVRIDDLYLHEFRHVPNTRLTPSGSKYGAGGLVDGCQILFAGAQAMGMADIGDTEWNEETDDYKNQQGIAIAKMFGFLKPQFYTQYSGGTTEDFGVMSLYVSQK